MAFNTFHRPSLAATAAARGPSSNGQQAVLTEHVQSIDLNAALSHRADQLVQQQVVVPQRQNRFDSVIDTDLITNQQLEVINDFVNQQHIDPMMGFDYGAMDQAMNQFEKMQQLIKDQIVYGDSGSWTWGSGPNGMWEHYDRGTQSVTTWYNSDGSVSHVKDDFNGTCKDSKWNDVNPDQCDESENKTEGEGRLPANKKNQNDSSESGNGNSIIAETEWPMGYSITDFSSNSDFSQFAQGLDLPLAQSNQQAQIFSQFF